MNLSASFLEFVFDRAAQGGDSADGYDRNQNEQDQIFGKGLAATIKFHKTSGRALSEIRARRPAFPRVLTVE